MAMEHLIERFGKELVHTVSHGLGHLANEQKGHVLMHGSNSGLSHGLASLGTFACAHPLALIGIIGGVVLVKTLLSDD